MQINIPEFSRSPYAFIVIGAVAIGFLIAVLYMRHFRVSRQAIAYTCLLTFICTIITSLVVAFKLSPEGISVGFSGLGAAVGMVGGIFLSSIIIKDKPDCVMASFVAAAPLMYGLAKFGCLFAGCCHGKDYHGPFAIVYHGENSGSYFPAQIIDMIAFISLFVIATVLIFKMKKTANAVFIIFAIVIPVRFALEYLKYYHEGGLIESGQITVLVAGILAFILLIIWKKVLKINYH